MKKKIIISNAIILFISMYLLLLVSSIVVNTLNQKSTENELKNYLAIASNIYDGTNYDEVIGDMKCYEKMIRITFIDESGNVIKDSLGQELDENHIDRPEIINPGKIYKRHSSTTNQNLIYISSYQNQSYLRIAILDGDVSKAITQMVIYVTSAIFVILAIAVLIQVRITKNSLEPIHFEIDRLSQIVGARTKIKGDDILVLSKEIDSLNQFIDDKMNQIKYEKNKVEFILNHLEQGFIALDEFKKILLINPKALTVLNAKKDNYENKDYLEIILNSKLVSAIDDVYEKKEDKVYEQELDGITYLIQLHIVDFNWINKNLHKGLLIMLTDITYKKNLERMKKEFFQNASHELKSPLTSILGYQQLIDNGILNTKEEIKDATKQTIKEASRMNQIIIEMLELSSLESLPMDELEFFDLKPLILDIINSYQLKASDKNIEIKYELEEKMVKASKKDMYHLFSNLIDNAIKYNKINGKINIKLNDTFEICDTGIGIEDCDLEKIFERFYRVDKAKSKELGGTGLGLSIVKHICLNYGFKINVYSKINEGTTFKIIFD